MISASARRLSVFKSVVDSGGFNLAAMKLGIAQPSVGAHIKALEGQIGQPLFLRDRGSRPRLTKAGEALYAYAVEMLDKSAATMQALAEIRSAAAHEITIAVHRDIASQFVSTRLSVFAAKYPSLRVITRIGTIDEVVEHVSARKATLGLFLTSGPTAGLRSEVLGHEPFELVVSPQHPLAKTKNLTAKMLAAFPFVTGLRGSRFNQLADAALKAIGLTAYNTSMELQGSPGGEGDGAPRRMHRLPAALHGGGRTGGAFAGGAEARHAVAGSGAALRPHRRAEPECAAAPQRAAPDGGASGRALTVNASVRASHAFANVFGELRGRIAAAGLEGTKQAERAHAGHRRGILQRDRALPIRLDVALRATHVRRRRVQCIVIQQPAVAMAGERRGT